MTFCNIRIGPPAYTHHDILVTLQGQLSKFSIIIDLMYLLRTKFNHVFIFNIIVVSNYILYEMEVCYFSNVFDHPEGDYGREFSYVYVYVYVHIIHDCLRLVVVLTT